jgi:hypothetical protein
MDRLGQGGQAEGKWDLGHLAASVRELALLDGKSRELAISRDRYIPHPAADQVLAEFEFLLNTDDSVRPQSRMLLAPPLHGKSTLIARFAEKHKASDNPDGDFARIPVLAIQHPPSATDSVFGEILNKLGIQVPTSATQSWIRKKCITMLRSVQCRMLLIDEFHHCVNGTHAQRKLALDAIKYLYNELGRPMILAGTQEVYNAAVGSQQIMSRFSPIVLRRFDHPDDADFINVLMGFEVTTPLRRPSRLFETAMRHQIHKMTLGTIGKVSDLVIAFARTAIATGEERITLEMLLASDWKATADEQTVQEAA